MGYIADRFNKRIIILIGGGIAMPALMALAVLKGNTTKAMGSVMGLITMAHSSGMLTGSLAAGLMMDMFQLRYAFSFGSIVMILGTGLFFFYTYRRKEKLLKTE
ncbi:MAG: hypothetical protein MUO43_12055 [Desulfobacterales bacterium]|nr:hypothetical protein [Desulfobacterales bacterium]